LIDQKTNLPAATMFWDLDEKLNLKTSALTAKLLIPADELLKMDIQALSQTNEEQYMGNLADLQDENIF